MRVGISSLQSTYANGTASDQQILDESKALILTEYANFTKAQMGGVDIEKALDTEIFPAFAPELLNIHVKACAIFKKKGY